ncbi:MAG: polyprenyl synthetase family protein [Actinomycetota bacterium]|nr:polyprenyl synthetase family protein [Actinomycetota bacterium]
MTGFRPTIAELRAAVDSELAQWLEDKELRLSHSGPLVAEMSRLLAAGGKRLRPSFCYWGYRAAAAPHSPRIMRAAASLELLHTFAIVHDDIMDQSDERRGNPTVHALHGVNAALLVGDLALVLADDMFMASGFDPIALAHAFMTYSRMRQEVIVGQWLDLEAAFDTETTEERARLVARLKSGRYSIEEPLAIGACLAGGSVELLGRLAAFGAPLGEAFQLRDDLLGLFGDRAETGKPIDSDIREGKHNVLYAKTRTALQGAERAFFEARWGGPGLTEDEVESLRSLVESSGARSATEALLQELVGRARSALEDIEAEDEVSHALEALLELSTARGV